ncbi:conserved hypothetical protein, partial [Ricinus communis]
MLVAVQAAQAFAHIGPADAGACRSRAGRQRRAVVVDGDVQHPAGRADRQPDRAALRAPRQSVLEAILHQRLQQQDGNAGRQQRSRCFHAVLQTLPEAHLLDGEVFVEEGQFLAQRNQIAVRLVQHAPQQFAEAGDGVDGIVVALLAHQAGDGVEGIEQEVRLDLPAQAVQLRLDALRLLQQQPLARMQTVADGEYGRVEHHVGDHAADEVLIPQHRPWRRGGHHPWIQQIFHARGPGGGDHADRQAGGEMAAPHAPSGAVTHGERHPSPQHGRRRQRPRQPIEKAEEEQRAPGVMHAGGAHQEDVLRG